MTGLGRDASALWKANLIMVWGMPGVMIFCGLAGIVRIVAVIIGAVFVFMGSPRRIAVITIDAIAAVAPEIAFIVGLPTLAAQNG